jgi:hypothetical protein
MWSDRLARLKAADEHDAGWGHFLPLLAAAIEETGS